MGGLLAFRCIASHFDEGSMPLFGPATGQYGGRFGRPPQSEPGLDICRVI